MNLLVAMGYGGSTEDAGRALGRSGDEGIDGIIKEDRLGLDVIYLQAKRWERTVARPEIQQFAGALQGQRAKKGVFVTTSAFSADARDYAARIDTRIVLIDGSELAKLMIRHGVGVTPGGGLRVEARRFRLLRGGVVPPIGHAGRSSYRESRRGSSASCGSRPDRRPSYSGVGASRRAEVPRDHAPEIVAAREHSGRCRTRARIRDSDTQRTRHHFSGGAARPRSDRTDNHGASPSGLSAREQLGMFGGTSAPYAHRKCLSNAVGSGLLWFSPIHGDARGQTNCQSDRDPCPCFR